MLKRSGTLPDIRTGLTLAALFGWLLAYPMFGPVLGASAGASTQGAGLVFVFAHGMGMILIQPFRLAGPGRACLTRCAGAVAAGLTLAALFRPLAAPPYLYIVMAVLGLTAAVLVLAWVDDWMRCSDRLAALAVAITGANLVLALANLSLGAAPGPWLVLTAALVSVATVGLGTDHPVTDASEATSPAGRGAVVALVAFALADYFVGGLWYSILAAFAPAGGTWTGVLDGLISSASVGLLYLLVRIRPRESLALYSLSALGIGLVLAAAGMAESATGLGFRMVLLFGLAAGDLFFWDQLGTLGAVWPARRVMGVGLGVSLLLIGMANIGSLLMKPVGTTGVSQSFLLVGAALIFAVIPLVFRFAASTRPADAEGTTQPAPAAWPPVPDLASGLTQAEHLVYGLLITGATDQEIADNLSITKHTVKFHVRNLLRKVGVANRKELLSLLVAEKNRTPRLPQ